MGQYSLEIVVSMKEEIKKPEFQDLIDKLADATRNYTKALAGDDSPGEVDRHRDSMRGLLEEVTNKKSSGINGESAPQTL